jgi:dCMP deaminase
MDTPEKWDIRFLQLAELVATWSKDPSTKVGAVIADEKHRVISLGYNGFPRGISDAEHIYLDRDKKYQRVLHAEQNAILFGSKAPSLHGCTIYTYPFAPCNRCCLEIIQSGITRVVSLKDYPERWKESIDLSLELLKEANIKVELF